MTGRSDWNSIESAIRARMAARELGAEITEEFLRRVRLVAAGASGKIAWDQILDLDDSDYARLDTLPAPDAASLGADVRRLVVIKLNGGLGTTMGLTRAKSLMRVKADDSFLQIIRKQILRLRETHAATVPLFFMDSFNTREDTLAEPGIADINAGAGLPADFLQNMVPRIYADTLLPVGDGRDDAHWCPPGHGDIFISLLTTGLLARLLDAGYRVAFLSNGDNLGATVDERLLAYFLREKLDFLSEVTPKTKADLKGGVLFRRKGDAGRGPIELLETAQVPADHLPDFEDVNRFAYFNINNLWVNLEALRDRLRAGGLDLSLIVNPKKLDGRDILQLETAMGAAVGCFEKVRVMIVPRTRFAPVKNCADLLVRRSDAYTLNPENLALEMNPARTGGEPVVTLSDHYKSIADFDRLVPVIPTLLHADRLTVQGPVLFDRAVEVHGTVTLSAPDGAPRPISALGRSTLRDETIAL